MCQSLYILLLLFCSFRLSKCSSGVNIIDQYPTHSHSIQKATDDFVIPFEHLSSYQNFVTGYQIVVKKQKDIYCVNTAKNNVSTILLVLFGDIHPWPGPAIENMQRTTYTSKQNFECQCFNKRRLHL